MGERSSHTWFVLKYLLGYDDVKNYDGSWTEWSNLIGAPNAFRAVCSVALPRVAHRLRALLSGPEYLRACSEDLEARGASRPISRPSAARMFFRLRSVRHR